MYENVGMLQSYKINWKKPKMCCVTANQGQLWSAAVHAFSLPAPAAASCLYTVAWLQNVWLRVTSFYFRLNPG